MDEIHSLEARVRELEKEQAVIKSEFANLDKRLSSIESTLKWLVFAILGAIVTGVMGFILQGGLVG